jgi:hypothetical protein
MLKSIENETKEIKKLVTKILSYHLESVLSKPVTDKTRVNQVMSWIEKASKDIKIN